ncbi:MAG: hypothetical protein IT211_09790 [Armatimonadetes bacterium]|nr:hypothetical protein [Armatimonadota bacterium]
MTATDHLAAMRSLIDKHPHITQIVVAREEADYHIGLFRYRIQFRNGNLLEAFERFESTPSGIAVLKYSFHLQDASGALIMRWDNAPHHPTVPSFPDHLHQGSEDNVLPNSPVTLRDILTLLG